MFQIKYLDKLKSENNFDFRNKNYHKIVSIDNSKVAQPYSGSTFTSPHGKKIQPHYNSDIKGFDNI